MRVESDSRSPDFGSATRRLLPTLTVRRAIGLAASGLLGTLTLLILLAPEAENPLRLTASLLPLLVSGFAALGQGNRGHSSPASRASWLVAVTGWGVLAIAWRHLALPHAATAVAAAGVLLLVGWLATQLPCLLRRLAGTGNALPPRVFFLLPFLVYLSALPWLQNRHTPGGDEPYFLLVAHSIAYDRDIDLANNYADGDALAFLPRSLEPQAGDPVGDEGQVYSRHPPAVPLLLALPYRLGGRTGATLVMMVLAAGVAWAGLALARELHPRRHRGQLLAWLVLAFCSPLAMYSYRFWAEVPATFGLTLASVVILRGQRERLPGIAFLLGLAFLLAYPVLIKLRFTLVSVPLAALVWWRTSRRWPAGRRWRLAVPVGAVLLIIGTAVVVLNLAQFDQVLGMNSLRALDLRRYPVDDWLTGLTGQFLDGAFGLAAAYPVWLFLLPALVLTVRRRPLSRGLLLAWVPYFLVLLPRSNAFGQFAPPFRYALAVLPVLAACMVPALEDRRASVRAITRALAGLTVVLAIVWTVQPEWTVHRVTGTTHLIDRLQLVTHSDIGRLFPSYLRVRTAAWVWAGMVLLLAACWRWWPARSRHRGFAAPLLLLATACIAWTASHAPTRTVELEDSWVEHHGGKELPEPWKPWAQPRAWRLAPGDSVRIPVIPGGPVLRPSLRLAHAGKAGQPVALELVADDGRVLRYWSDELDPRPFWQWKTLPSVALSVERPVGLTIRAVEPPRADPRPLSIQIRGVNRAPRQLRLALRVLDTTRAYWKGIPDPNHWIRVPVRRLRWRAGESHPLVQVPRGRSKTGSRGSPVVLRFRFEPPQMFRAELRAGGERLGVWSGTWRRESWRQLEESSRPKTGTGKQLVAGEPSPPLVWRLPRHSYGTIALDRARFVWKADPTPGSASSVTAPTRTSGFEESEGH